MRRSSNTWASRKSSRGVTLVAAVGVWLLAAATIRATPESVRIGEDEEFDGGFSTLDSMLQWSISQSDPIKLKEEAENAQRMPASDLQKRQLEIKEMMEQLKTPSDAQLMEIAIADLNNSSLALEDRYRALQELLILVESIDNANDMNKLGGLAAVIRELNNSDQQTRIMSAWILGQACQNNPIVEKQILGLGALEKLMEMVNSSSVEEATKGLYAVSALIRNNIDGQESFHAKSGELMLQDILNNPTVDIRLKKKSVSLVADLAAFQLESINQAMPLPLNNPFFLKSVVDLATSTDIDLQEKALIAVKRLLQLKTTEGPHFRDVCGLDNLLESLKGQLQQLMTDQDQRDFIMDLESLRGEVELIFRKKLEKGLGKKDKSPPTQVRWVKPPQNMVKVNVDPAFRPNDRRGGTGGVIRDSSGEVVVAFALPIQISSSSQQAELMVIKMGIKVALDSRYTSFIVESDAKGVVDKILQEEEDPGPFGNLVKEFKMEFANILSLLSFKFVSRSCNTVTHELAQYGVNLLDGLRWNGCTPFFVNSFVLADSI